MTTRNKKEAPGAVTPEATQPSAEELLDFDAVCARLEKSNLDLIQARRKLEDSRVRFENSRVQLVNARRELDDRRRERRSRITTRVKLRFNSGLKALKSLVLQRIVAERLPISHVNHLPTGAVAPTQGDYRPDQRSEP
ncbi:hypothetical protein OS128_05305 [Corynebacterium sp. P5848]|uniref:hypothetical protein n=1 Tax=Corynebacterium marambiense TaxID=2765364 RepID=UPI002260D3D4|nr:hypothetical protein [Corynebacterium marambiense]MCX7542328.1 hypothetical protein [Corynebacterium marambiense]